MVNSDGKRYHVAARLDLVYFGIQQSSGNTVILLMFSARGHDRCRYHNACAEGYPYLQERLKHASIQMQSMGYEVKSFSSLRKKIKDYGEEYQAIANPFNPRSYLLRPNPSPFAKLPNATPVRRKYCGYQE